MLLRIYFLFTVVAVAIGFTHLLNVQKLRALESDRPAITDVQAY
jgi:hypothetical protein